MCVAVGDFLVCWCVYVCMCVGVWVSVGVCGRASARAGWRACVRLIAGCFQTESVPAFKKAAYLAASRAEGVGL